MIKQKSEQEIVKEFIEKNKVVKYTVYAASTVIGIWILGKSSKLLADAVVGFKQLHHSIKH